MTSQKPTHEELLRQREITLSSIFRAAPTGIGMVCDRTITQANEQLCQMLGYSEAELLGQSARLLYPSDEEFEFVGREKYARIRENDTGSVETRWQRKNGEVIDVMLSSAPLDSKDLSVGVTFTALDITERKQVEQRYREIVEGTDNLVTEVDSEGRFTFVNETSLKVFGLTPEECIGRFAFDFIHPDDREKTQEHFSRWVKDKRQSVTFENRQVDQSGEVRDMLWTINFHFDDTGNIASIKSIARDITERRKAEDALRKAHEELEQRVEERTAELANANENLHQEIEERKQAQKEREKVINELQEALKEIKTLRGILPLCSFCKKIRDDKGYWEQVDVYIHKHSQADISHGICPDCAKEHYPDLDIYDD